MYAFYIANFIGVFLFLFVFWRSLKEDYVSMHIFTLSFYSLVGIGAGLLVGHYFLREWWFWLSFVGSFLGLAGGIFKYKLRFFEVLEAAVKAYLPWYAVFMLVNLIGNAEIGEIMMTTVTLLLIILFELLRANYKNFSWYRSGKVGFAGLSVLGIFFLCKAVIALYFPNMVSFSGKYGAYLSGAVSLTAFIALINLARRKV